VLVDRHIDVRSTQVLELPGSDHRTQLARLEVGRPTYLSFVVTSM